MEIHGFLWASRDCKAKRGVELIATSETYSPEMLGYVWGILMKFLLTQKNMEELESLGDRWMLLKEYIGALSVK
jgi:hypothetical protein